jgi:hypothetical protein
MRRSYLILLTTLFLSCSKPEHDIEKGIREMEGIVEEADTTSVLEECRFDSSVHALTWAVIRGIPDLQDVRWLDSVKGFEASWRSNQIRRTKGGCMRFNDNLWVRFLDNRPLTDEGYWLEKAHDAARHFGIPHYPVLIKSGVLKLDSSRSDRHLRTYFVDSTNYDLPTFDGITIHQDDQGTLIRLEMHEE